MCVFQDLLADFIDTHNKFIAPLLALYCYCQVPGMQSSVLMEIHKLKKHKVSLLLSRPGVAKLLGSKMRGEGGMHHFNTKKS